MKLKLIILCICICPNIFAQGLYLDKGKSGIGLNYGYSWAEENSVSAYGIGFSLIGIIDIGFTQSKNSFKHDKFTTASLSTKSSSLSLIAKKPDEKSKSFLLINASYLIGDGLKPESIVMGKDKATLKISGYSLGVMLGWRTHQHPKLCIFPSIGVLLGMIKVEEKNDYYDTVRKSETSITNVVLGSSFVFRFNSIYVNVDPAFSFDPLGDDDAIAAMSIGLIYGDLF